jgi:hypothetical protein
MRYPAQVLLAVLLCATTVICAAVHADEVYLKGGGQLSGRVVSRSDTKVEVDVGAGRVAVPASRVLRIEAGRSALQEYEERAGLLAAGDAEGWLALAQWAEGKGLGTQARESYHRVLSVSPSDARANEALGNVRLDGRWVSEDESYRARGYVRFDGQWMTPAEQQAILRERDAVSERDRRHQEAEVRARDAEAQAEEAEARARQAEADAEASNGIPMWYVWGAGPAYWPAGPTARPPVAPPSRPTPRPVPR